MREQLFECSSIYHTIQNLKERSIQLDEKAERETSAYQNYLDNKNQIKCLEKLYKNNCRLYEIFVRKF